MVNYYDDVLGRDKAGVPNFPTFPYIMGVGTRRQEGVLKSH